MSNGQDQPWSEKIPGLGGAGPGMDSKTALAAISKMLSTLGKGQSDQPGGQAGQPGFVPGNVPPIPGSTISFNPSGSPGAPLMHAPAPPSGQVPPTGSQSIGHFANRGEATNAGLVSLGNSLTGLFGAAEEKAHAKKAATAEGYMLQISGLLASGKPEDREKAQMFMDDPKIRKVLKDGLSYVPLEEKVPPEAEGVQSAVKKIAGIGGSQQQGPQLPQQQPQQQRMRAVLPQASAQQELQSAGINAMIQMLRKDPEKALSMMGASHLTSAEERMAELYKSGFQMSPADYQAMSSAEKIAGIKTMEEVMKDTLKAEVDIYKSKETYRGKIDAAHIYAASRDRLTDALKSKAGNKGSTVALGAAKVYSDFSKQYMDMVKSGKDESGRPFSDEQKKAYEDKAKVFQDKADKLLKDATSPDENELWKMFMGYTGNQPLPGEEPSSPPQE
jgi:hypothetical protein